MGISYTPSQPDFSPKTLIEIINRERDQRK